MPSLNVLFAVAINLFLQSFVLGDPAKPCDPDICKLPDCFCSGTEIPGNLSLSSIPQIVFVTTDAAINAEDFFDYEKLFDGSLKNQTDAIFREHSLFLMSTPIIVRFKIFTVNVTKSLTIRSPDGFLNHGGQMLQRKNRTRK